MRSHFRPFMSHTMPINHHQFNVIISMIIIMIIAIIMIIDNSKFHNRILSKSKIWGKLYICCGRILVVAVVGGGDVVGVSVGSCVGGASGGVHICH